MGNYDEAVEFIKEGIEECKEAIKEGYFSVELYYTKKKHNVKKAILQLEAVLELIERDGKRKKN